MLQTPASILCRKEKVKILKLYQNRISSFQIAIVTATAIIMVTSAQFRYSNPFLGSNPLLCFELPGKESSKHEPQPGIFLELPGKESSKHEPQPGIFFCFGASRTIQFRNGFVSFCPAKFLKKGIGEIFFDPVLQSLSIIFTCFKVPKRKYSPYCPEQG
jgi:hypothetical protein